ncbi:hypothetical protein [Methylobacterium gregans]|uniref:Uncharacterized protein n=1 Tax=Methylobacterium gregans TaxID=374424 RepID=A0AA37MA72_9HYPH|nr:hypothetical protein [Methylobacterium gregans]MDQ0521965.1 hypothetical protein [Methylobacterium gregans]GJD78001.1 hypothetical protein NBEOAGPD_1213 [Methylobacterium gregans]GLS51970.1 hypothetical protein GCM10007886_01520 [Methylobacterium gregans]
MPAITVRLDGVMERYAKQLQAMGTQAPVIMTTALMSAAPQMERALEDALTPQTGLLPGTIARAVTYKGGALSLTFRTQGGDVRLKFFKPHETEPGVSAAPRNARSTFPGTFMRAGWWAKRRVDKPGWNGQVFRRAGGKTKTGKARFTTARSDMAIPDEMVKGASLGAWERGQAAVLTTVEHRIMALLP